MLSRVCVCWFLLVSLWVGAVGAQAEPIDETTAGTQGTSVDDEAQAATSALEPLSRLEAIGLTISPQVVWEYSAVVSGGIRTSGDDRAQFVLDAELDLGRAFGVRGGTAFAQFLSVDADRGGIADSGDLQIYSNLESDRSLDVIYELWYEQRIFDDQLRVKLGKIDANGSFAAPESAGEFAHSSAGFAPTIFVFPSYPDPASGVEVFFSPSVGDQTTLEIGYGFFDGSLAEGVRTGRGGPSSLLSGDPSGALFHIAQIGVGLFASDPSGFGLRRVRLVGGAWISDATFAAFDGSTEHSTSGSYAIIEFDFGEHQDSGFSLFAQYGHADEQVSAVGQHIALGAVRRAPFVSRPNDSVGLYASLAVLSDAPGAGFADDELALDCYYHVQVTESLSVRPEVQYIINPSGSAQIDDALVVSFRVGVAF